LGPFWAICNNLRPFGTIWDNSGPFGTIWDHLGPFGTILDHSGTFGTILDYSGPFGTILDYSGPFGTIWDHLGPFGRLICTSNLASNLFAGWIHHRHLFLVTTHRFLQTHIYFIYTPCLLGLGEKVKVSKTFRPTCFLMYFSISSIVSFLKFFDLNAPSVVKLRFYKN